MYNRAMAPSSTFCDALGITRLTLSFCAVVNPISYSYRLNWHATSGDVYVSGVVLWVSLRVCLYVLVGGRWLFSLFARNPRRRGFRWFVRQAVGLWACGLVGS